MVFSLWKLVNRKTGECNFPEGRELDFDFDPIFTEIKSPRAVFSFIIVYF